MNTQQRDEKQKRERELNGTRQNVLVKQEAKASNGSKKINQWESENEVRENKRKWKTTKWIDCTRSKTRHWKSTKRPENHRYEREKNKSSTLPTITHFEISLQKKKKCY